jgi:hypothetical protein
MAIALSTVLVAGVIFFGGVNSDVWGLVSIFIWFYSLDWYLIIVDRLALDRINRSKDCRDRSIYQSE